jgi:class 3 adenylate cyclase
MPAPPLLPTSVVKIFEKALNIGRILHENVVVNTAAARLMQEIADWLEKLGMSEYTERFAENGIDVSVLRDLTDQDLKDIGVLLGHRRKLLRAIADLGTIASTAPSPVAAPAVADTLPRDTAERRQVTVMFSDLVGSTALSARMDPEDLREVISAYQNCVAATARRFGGFVAKYLGDGVLVYFGFPLAHEDDPERAVRAGLDIVDAVSRLKTHAPLQTRVGIATGLVVVGDLIGSGASQDKQSSARPLTLLRDCKALRTRMRSSLRRALGSSWATCSSLRTLGHRT